MSNEYDEEATKIREREAGLLTVAQVEELIRAVHQSQAELSALRLTHGDTVVEVNGDAARPVAIGLGVGLVAIGIGLGVAIASGSSSDS